MPVAHLMRFTSTDPDQILSQLRAYVERDLDGSPPRGFKGARILRGADERTVAFYTEWASEEALSNIRNSAPWQACMDLNDVFSDIHDEATYFIET